MAMESRTTVIQDRDIVKELMLIATAGENMTKVGRVQLMNITTRMITSLVSRYDTKAIRTTWYMCVHIMWMLLKR